MGVGTAKEKKAKIKIYVTVDNFQLHFSCIEEHVETGLCSKRDQRRQTLAVRQRCPVVNRTYYFWYIIFIRLYMNSYVDHCWVICFQVRQRCPSEKSDLLPLGQILHTPLV